MLTMQGIGAAIACRDPRSSVFHSLVAADPLWSRPRCLGAGWRHGRW